MIELANFTFLQPLWLLLLAPLWWLLWMLARNGRRKSMWNRLCDIHLLEKLQGGEEAAGNTAWLVWPLAIALTLATLAAAGPSWRKQVDPMMKSASARIIALDLSRAMLVKDIKPSRFAHALAATREIIDADFDGETGLVVFAGSAFVVSPLSRDSNTLLAFLDALEPGIMPLDGNRIDLAIDRAQDLLLASISGSGQIIVVASGNERHANAVQAALTARNRGHQVSLVAVGTVAGAPLIADNGALVKDSNGEFMLARTSFTELREIADAGNGLLVKLSEATAYDKLLGSRIQADNLVEASTHGEDDGREAANDGIWLVWLLLPFTLLLFRRNLLWTIAVALMLPLDNASYATEESQNAVYDSIWQHRERLAFEAYRQGDFRRSAETSTNPMLQGAAFYKSGDYQQAAERFRRLDSPESQYNLGNALAQLNKLPEAIAAYSRALEQDPDFVRARYNKRLLELYIEQQTENEDAAASDSADDSGNLEPLRQSGSESRSETANQELNPGDEQRLEAGFGASLQYGQLDPFEQFDGREQRLERFTPGEEISQAQADSIVSGWMKNLPAASSELFRRKFLRDYQRQRRQPR